ncbi:MAG: hypothetical protein GYB65_18805 [Chloroflexi bacterium]|nr:hypothetical protein [Chloroflexota bacterium]
MKVIYRLVLLVLPVLVLALAGCDELSEPVIEHVDATPADRGFVTYVHQTGVFSLRHPPGWRAEELLDYSGVRVQFSSVENGEELPWLSVYVVNTGEPRSPEAFEEKIASYLPPEDLARYPWQEFERTTLDDLSRRIAGVRTYPQLGPRTLNVFLQQDGVFFSALELDITAADEDRLAQLQAVVNTYRIDPQADLAIAAVQQAAGVVSQSGVIGFSGYTAWTDSQGVFHITGEVLNTTDEPLGGLRLTAVLYDNQGRELARQRDDLARVVLMPCSQAPCRAREGVPFDLRFEQGRLPGAVRYDLEVTASASERLFQSYYGQENFLVNVDYEDYDDRGRLVFRGTVTNAGPYPAQKAQITVALWDADDNVVGTDDVQVTAEELPVGIPIPFELTVNDIGGDAIQKSWIVSGEVAQ